MSTHRSAQTATTEGPTVLATEPVTLAVSDGLVYYLTECCAASGKGSVYDGFPRIVCRQCDQEVSALFGDEWGVADETGWAGYEALLRSAGLPDTAARERVAQAQAAAPVLAEAVKNLLVDWFPVRDRLCDLRSKDFLSAGEEQEVWQALNELVDIGDELVAHFAPDAEARFAITGELLP